MHRRKIFDPYSSIFGVLVAAIHGVRFAGVKPASRGRRGSSGSCYNRRRINDLGSGAASAKMIDYFHRHAQGENVKRFVLVAGGPLSGTTPNYGATKKGILIIRREQC